MVVDVPAGKGQVKLSFLPNGFKLASLLSLAGFTLFIIYNYGYRHFLQKKAKASGH